MLLTITKSSTSRICSLNYYPMLPPSTKLWTEEPHWFLFQREIYIMAAAAAKSLQSCPTLWDPIDGSSPGSLVPGILQARTLEWVAISFSNVWKWKVKVKSLSRVWLFAIPWTAANSLLRPWDFPGKSTGVGCHCLLHIMATSSYIKRKSFDLKTLNSRFKFMMQKVFSSLGYCKIKRIVL